MKLVDRSIPICELEQMVESGFYELIKAVVDIHKGIMVVDAEMHADEEQWLLENGSDQKDLWGINLYPKLPPEKWIEFDSMINIRPWENNRSRGVENPLIKEKITNIVNQLVIR
jgi:hypothetical protein